MQISDNFLFICLPLDLISEQSNTVDSILTENT